MRKKVKFHSYRTGKDYEVDFNEIDGGMDLKSPIYVKTLKEEEKNI